MNMEVFARTIDIIQDTQLAMIFRLSRTFDKVKHSIFSHLGLSDFDIRSMLLGFQSEL